MKPVKIKRNRSIYSKRGKHAKSILRIVLSLFACVCLVAVGFLVAEPVMNFLSGKYNVAPEPPSDSSSQSSEDSPQTSSSEQEEKTLKMTYLSVETAANAASLDEFLSTAKEQGYTAIYVTWKDDDGKILYASGDETYAPYEAAGAPSMETTVQKITEAGLTPVAGISMFEDATLAYARRDLAIGYNGPSTLWLDDSAENGGRPWLNPYNTQAQDFLKDEISFVLKAGFKEVVLTGVQFPQYGGEGSYAYYGDTSGTTRESLLQTFLTSVKGLLGDESSAAVECSYTVITGAQTEMYPIQYGKTDLKRTYVTMSAEELGISAGSTQEQAKNAVTTAMNTLKSVCDGEIIPVLSSDTPHLADVLSALEAAGYEEYLVR